MGEPAWTWTLCHQPICHPPASEDLCMNGSHPPGVDTATTIQPQHDRSTNAAQGKRSNPHDSRTRASCLPAPRCHLSLAGMHCYSCSSAAILCWNTSAAASTAHCSWRWRGLSRPALADDGLGFLRGRRGYEGRRREGAVFAFALGALQDGWIGRVSVGIRRWVDATG